MTDASTIVATIDNRLTRAVPETTGNARRTGGKAKEAVKTKGKTFADSLNNARSRQAGESDKFQKPAKALKRKKSTSVRLAAGTARRASRTGSAGVPGTDPGRSRPSDRVHGAAERSGRTDIPESEISDHADGAAIQETPAPEDQGVLVQVSKAATPQIESRTRSGDKSGRGDSGSGSEGVSAKRAVRTVIEDAGLKSADLSSRSGRVEIVDNREFPKVEGKITSALDAKTKAAAPKIRGDVPLRSEPAPVAVAGNDSFTAAETEIDISPASGRVGTGRGAAAELARKLEGEAGGDIVRQVKVVLNRSNAGEVRINLRPDNLGRVRVRIQLEDNRLTGRIFVESAAAREAFRDAIGGLQTKLVEAGFGAADLELAWDESAQDFADGNSRNGRKSEDSGHSAREFENMVPVTVVDEAADGRVNLVV